MLDFRISYGQSLVSVFFFLLEQVLIGLKKNPNEAGTSRLQCLVYHVQQHGLNSRIWLHLSARSSIIQSLLWDTFTVTQNGCAEYIVR